jgi:hypothetical protein
MRKRWNLRDFWCQSRRNLLGYVGAVTPTSTLEAVAQSLFGTAGVGYIRRLHRAKTLLELCEIGFTAGAHWVPGCSLIKNGVDKDFAEQLRQEVDSIMSRSQKMPVAGCVLWLPRPVSVSCDSVVTMPHWCVTASRCP